MKKRIKITEEQQIFFAKIAEYFGGIPPMCIDPDQTTSESWWNIGKEFALSIPAHMYNFAAQVDGHDPDCLPKNLLDRHIDEWHENWTHHAIGAAWFQHRLIALDLDKKSRNRIDILISKFGKVDQKAHWAEQRFWRHHPCEVFGRLSNMPRK